MCIIKVSLGLRGGVSVLETLCGPPGPGLHGLLCPRCHPGCVIREGQPRSGHSVTQTQTPQGRGARRSVDMHGLSRRRPRLPGELVPPAEATQGLWLQGREEAVGVGPGGGSWDPAALHPGHGACPSFPVGHRLLVGHGLPRGWRFQPGAEHGTKKHSRNARRDCPFSAD